MYHRNQAKILDLTERTMGICLDPPICPSRPWSTTVVSFGGSLTLMHESSIQGVVGLAV